ncbi:helix-turn-helix transcriptional regulator [Lachnospiraceae bacterium MD1]|uniref:Helix-turn-helix transcriptional regulator n=1 Tax=Variimorphobacter saccharofermentans TaxID=2755051 RepID=A0A839K396_9FIRM|nr:AraC family transcriptional regulator [Variimorphobacter saccharofermentans]MBB2184383.1 helix-turn-helix transcriptional regulator [Variimorphobacter saccharofermentans]
MRILDGIYEKVDYQNNTSILLHINNTNDNYSIHWHTAIEMIMPIENIYTIVIGKTTYVLQENDILIIPPGELHELIAPPTGTRRILLFDFSLISNLRGLSNILTVLNQPRLINQVTAPDIHSRLMQLFHDITEEYTNKNTLREAAIYALIIQMFVLTGRKYMNTENLFPDVKLNKQREYIEKFNLIFEYINNNFTDGITLDTIAGVAGFSKFHFSRLFKQFTDMSFYDYLNQRRVKEAEKLLLDPTLAITEVAMRSGFSSIATFNRVFKSFKECTPTEFKNLYRRRNHTP